MNDDRRLFEELLAENTKLHKDRIPCGISRKRIAQKTAFLTGLGIKQTWAPLRRCAAVGCAALIAVGSLGVYAVAEEARQYDCAVNFLREHYVNIEGMNRNEIKTAYRELTLQLSMQPGCATAAASAAETAQISATVGTDARRDQPQTEATDGIEGIYGCNITPIWPEFTPLERQRNASNYYDTILTGKNMGGAALIRRIYDTAPADGIQKCYIACFREGEECWRVPMPGNINDLGPYTELHGGDIIQCSAGGAVIDIICVSADGRIKEKNSIKTSLSYASCIGVFENDNGSLTFILIGRNGNHGQVLEIIVTDERAAECISRHKCDIEVGDGRKTAYRAGDGYIIKAKGPTVGQAVLITFDENGIRQTRIYSDKGRLLTVDSVLQIGDKLYISAHSAAIPENSSYIYDEQWADIAAVLEKIDDKYGENFVSTTEEACADIARMMRENVTAILMVCDAQTGQPESFYSTEGAIGDKLRIKDGKLLWSVMRPEYGTIGLYSGVCLMSFSCSTGTYTFSQDMQSHSFSAVGAGGFMR